MASLTFSFEQQTELIQLLKTRFEKNMSRHENLDWQDIQTRMENNINTLSSLLKMEQTGGEPDIIGYDTTTEEYIFCDCSPESPKGRRSLCYDREALESRKEHKPESTVTDMATDIGIEILTEEQYRELQQLGEFDVKTSSWIYTPSSIRERGWALFCDRRYNQVFTYHNGADSYYAVRGFRGLLRV